MIALWILLGLAALLGLLLTLPLRLHLRYTPEDGFAFRVYYAVFRLASSEAEQADKAPKPAQRQKERPASGAKDALLRFLGLGDLSSAKAAKQALREEGLLQTMQQAAEAVAALLRRLFRLLSRGVFRRFTLHITVGGDDPADTALRYGSICAALYPLLSLLGERLRLRRKDVSVRCDYDATQTRVCFEGCLCYRPWHLLALLCGLIWDRLRRRR